MGDVNEDTYDNFMRVCAQFKLGDLVTESPNPISANLSQECQEDLARGLRTLQNVDRAALATPIAVLSDGTVERMASAIHDTLVAGNTVMLVGCGATGRLSLSVEVFCREGMIEPQYRDQVKGFMAGGDLALIRSIEKFEDKEEYGRQQLRDLGFKDGDLILAITEGGETPFVIAACEEAVVLSPSRQHYFLYCNPDDILCRVAERSRRMIQDQTSVIKLNLTHGPMAVTGSTRMQATTVQLLVAGLAVQYHAHPERIRPAWDLAVETITRDLDYGALAPFTDAEAALYRAQQLFLYETSFFTVTVMTDTTERAPTFSFPPFENFDLVPHALESPVYLHLPGTSDSVAAWSRMLHREVRGIEWPETRAQTASSVIYGYDFSDRCHGRRRERYGEERTKAVLSVDRFDAGIRFENRDAGIRIDVPLKEVILGDILLSNIVAKVLLNAHSTAIMARNGRLDGNVMLYVRPTNNKLIDRAARYVRLVLENGNRRLAAANEPQVPIPAYAEIVRHIYEQRAVLRPDVPVVVAVVNAIRDGAAVAARTNA